jgi:hypothetical protein
MINDKSLRLLFQLLKVKIHVHTNVSLLVVGAMLSQNVTWTSDQPIVYDYRLLNRAKQNL